MLGYHLGGNLEATLGGEKITFTVENPTKAGLQMIMPVLPYGDYKLLINWKGKGLAKNDLLITNELKIDSISPKTGS